MCVLVHNFALYTFVVFEVSRPGHGSRMCSCASLGSLFSCWYVFLKFVLMSSILVLALNIIDVSILLTSRNAMYTCRYVFCSNLF